jgi:D-glycero-D-manno-heptose 1,7-bisphosphate phosphatase
MRGKQLHGVLFLDRDGVINFDRRDYVKSWSEFKFMPRVFEALRLLKKNNVRVVVITNQSAVHRGLMSISTLREIHEKMLRAIERKGGSIEAIYVCPHTPEENCRCRKPKPGMVLKAVKDLKIDLSRSYLVGDSEKDVNLAQSLAIKCIRITDGTSHCTCVEGRGWTKKSPILARSLLEAVNYILHGLKESPGSPALQRHRRA